MSEQSELVPGTKIEFSFFQVPVETRLPSGNFYEPAVING